MSLKMGLIGFFAIVLGIFFFLDAWKKEADFIATWFWPGVLILFGVILLMINKYNNDRAEGIQQW